ncbi:hypothetical protein [uncultured Nostoc sp.]|uniref:hypothetical protein n=1 Tax=uncultured Nostoc sp. TaxID=340711 RepID=UPI0035CB6731
MGIAHPGLIKTLQQFSFISTTFIVGAQGLAPLQHGLFTQSKRNSIDAASIYQLAIALHLPVEFRLVLRRSALLK